MKKYLQFLAPALVLVGALLIGQAENALASSICFIPNGCTGTSTAPTLGQVLVGDRNGNYELAATSTFGGFSTTSANAWAGAGLGFSTTSTNAWSAAGLGFSTTSSNYWGSTKGYATFAYPFPAGATSSLVQLNGNASTTVLSVSRTGTATTTISGDATSTFAGGGINLTSGFCYAINGACLTAGAIGGGATEAVNWATTAVLSGTPTYSNGASGVGATLTEVGTGALSVDGNAPAANDRVLVQTQASAFQDGIYVVTATGSGIASYVLTRANDYNTPTEITPGLNTYVLSGTANTDTTWAVSYTPPLVIGTNNLTYTKSAAGGTVTSINNGSTGSTLTFTGGPITTSGTINGELNLTHANAWTGLQNFALASSTLSSVFSKLYVGGTSTTTIDSAGNIVIPSVATLTNTGVTNGCATWASGVLGTTGTACASGGGGAGNWFSAVTAFGTTTAATSTPINALEGIIASSTSYMSNLQLGSSTIAFSNAPLVISGNVNNYDQAVLQNTNNGSNASANFIVGGNLMTDTTYYGDLGYNSSTNNEAAYTGFAANDLFLYNNDASIDIAAASTTNANALIKFFVGGTLAANQRAVITTTGFGIGTTSPYAPLSVVGSGGVVAQSFTATSTAATSSLQNTTVHGPELWGYQVHGFTYLASSTAPVALIGSSSMIALPSLPVNFKIDTGWCDLSKYGGGTAVVALGNTTATATPMFTASSTVNINTFTSNNSFTANQTPYAVIGTPTGGVTGVPCFFQYEATSY